MSERKKETSAEATETEQEAPAATPAIDIAALKAELMAELRKEMSETPAPAVRQQVIISNPVTEAEAIEADRLAEQTKQISEADAWLNEKIPIKLFKDGKDYKDDLFLSINGENVQIKRGVPVMVKRKFVLLIEQSEAQNVKAAEYSEEQQENYKNAVTLGAI